MSRYADFPSASPRCQQILQTIELTSQQGIFIYDLTFLQQELEASLLAAVQRRDELQRSSNGEVLTLPSTSFVRLANGQKPRDFKAERERRRKAFAGQMTRKRRRKQPKKPKEIRPTNVDETKLSNVEQFWLDVVEERRETFDEENLRSIAKLIDVDEEFLRHFHEEIPEKIRWKETIRSAKDYCHPELRHSLVVQQNEFFHDRVKILRKKFPSLKTIERGQTNVSSNIDENVLAMLRRDDRKFSSKNAELEHRLTESIRLERFALAKAKEEVRRETIGTQLKEIEEKIRQITNSIRQRKRPSESIVSPTAPLNSANETEPWRKNRRASTLRVYDELSRLINEHVQIERQLNEMKT